MKKPCPLCASGTLQRRSRKQTFRYKGQAFKYDQPGDWCAKCGEGILSNSDLKAVELQLSDFRSEVDGYLCAGDLRRIRSKLGLSQKAAAEIFGGGHNAFCRYERGLARQPKALDKLLRLLDQHPDLLAEITSRRDKTAA